MPSPSPQLAMAPERVSPDRLGWVDAWTKGRRNRTWKIDFGGGGAFVQDFTDMDIAAHSSLVSANCLQLMLLYVGSVAESRVKSLKPWESSSCFLPRWPALFRFVNAYNTLLWFSLPDYTGYLCQPFNWSKLRKPIYHAEVCRHPIQVKHEARSLLPSLERCFELALCADGKARLLALLCHSCKIFAAKPLVKTIKVDAVS